MTSLGRSHNLKPLVSVVAWYTGVPKEPESIDPVTMSSNT